MLTNIHEYFVWCIVLFAWADSIAHVQRWFQVIMQKPVYYCKLWLCLRVVRFTIFKWQQVETKYTFIYITIMIICSPELCNTYFMTLQALCDTKAHTNLHKPIVISQGNYSWIEWNLHFPLKNNPLYNIKSSCIILWILDGIMTWIYCYCLSLFWINDNYNIYFMNKAYN